MGGRSTLCRETVTAKAKLRLSTGGDGGRPAILELEGELDFDAVPGIDRFLRRTLGPLYHRHHLVIDLVGATFVDSGVISFLARLAALQRGERRELLLVRPRGEVRRAFGVVGLPNVVPVFESTDAAVESLRCSGVPVIPPVFRPTQI